MTRCTGWHANDHQASTRSMLLAPATTSLTAAARRKIECRTCHRRRYPSQPWIQVTTNQMLVSLPTGSGLPLTFVSVDVLQQIPNQALRSIEEVWPLCQLTHLEGRFSRWGVLAQARPATCEKECLAEERRGISACNRRSRWRRYGMTKWQRPQKPLSTKTAYREKAAAILAPVGQTSAWHGIAD